MPTPTKPVVFGIDVSHHQDTVDWKKVARSGVRFAIIKSTEGVDFTNVLLDPNLTGVIDADLIPGAYHFLTGARPGKEQAQDFIAALDALGAPHDLLYALDVERLRAPRPDKHDVVDFAAEFARLRPGRKLIIYTGETFWKKLTENLDGHSRGWVLWDTGDGNTPNVYVSGEGTITHLYDKVVTKGWESYGGWKPRQRAFLQFTDSAKVPGVPTKCDADAFFGTETELLRLLRPERDVDLSRLSDARALFNLTWRGRLPAGEPLTLGTPGKAPATLLADAANTLREATKLASADHGVLSQLIADIATHPPATADLDGIAAAVAASVQGRSSPP